VPSIHVDTPRQSIEAACASVGRDRIVDACIDLLRAQDVDPSMLRILAGPRADRESDSPAHAAWLRVWGARGLLWAWDDRALPALCVALTDEAWRVREMAVKVVARQLLGDAGPQVSALRDDPVPRVRAAAARALTRLANASA